MSGFGRTTPLFGRSKVSTIGSNARIFRRADSTPAGSPAMETWFDFSVDPERFESGKWIWQPVSSITFLIVEPPFPITCECSVWGTSIFNVTRVDRASNLSKIISFARLTDCSSPHTFTWGSFFDLAPILSFDGQVTIVPVSSITFWKNISPFSYTPQPGRSEAKRKEKLFFWSAKPEYNPEVFGQINLQAGRLFLFSSLYLISTIASSLGQ